MTVKYPRIEGVASTNFPSSNIYLNYYVTNQKAGN